MPSPHVLQQANDQKIVVPIVLNGEPFDTSNLTLASYKIYDFRKKNVLLEKSINNGISAQNDELIIDISQVDCLTLVGNYYHELTVVDREKGRSTVFKNDLTFEPTKNREE